MDFRKFERRYQFNQPYSVYLSVSTYGLLNHCGHNHFPLLSICKQGWLAADDVYWTPIYKGITSDGRKYTKATAVKWPLRGMLSCGRGGDIYDNQKEENTMLHCNLLNFRTKNICYMD